MTALALFGTLALCLIIGIPVAFSIVISSIVTLAANSGIPYVIMTQKMIDGSNSFTLIAIPLFILAGTIMLHGSSPRIMAFVSLLVHKKRWGIGNAGIVGCTAFGTVTGSTVATTTAIGNVVIPNMLKKGYGKGFTASVIAGSGTLGSVIPPSIGFVVYAQVANVSITDMFLAGILPGILTATLLMLVNQYLVRKRNWCIDDDEVSVYEVMSLHEKLKIAADALLPLLMPVFILGGIVSGIVTPTEAATVACVYALLLAKFIYKELDTKTMISVFISSAISSATLLLILSVASPFAWMIARFNIASTIATFITSLSNNIVIVYGLIMLILLIMGTFMEGLAILLLTVPIFLPILQQFGVDPVAYGITSCLIGGVGAVTPPLAVALFASCKIVNIKIEEVFPDVFYVIFAMLTGAILSAIFPIISTFLPSIIN